VDAGHLVRDGRPVSPLLARYGRRVPIVHLHGVDFSFSPPRDHQGLDKTPLPYLRDTLAALSGYPGVLSLEVFSASRLSSSLTRLSEFWTLPDLSTLCLEP
jgi:sugar phosphate isomerase/epimerase